MTTYTHILRPSFRALIAAAIALFCPTACLEGGSAGLARSSAPLSLRPASPLLCGGGPRQGAGGSGQAGARATSTASGGSYGSYGASGASSVATGRGGYSAAGSAQGPWPGVGSSGRGGGAAWEPGAAGFAQGPSSGGDAGTWGPPAGGSSGAGSPAQPPGSAGSSGLAGAAGMADDGCGEAGAGGEGHGCAGAGGAGAAFLQTGLCPGVDLTSEAKFYLSPDDSGSMASPAVVRSLIRAGHFSFAQGVVRTHEMLNYYRFSFAPARPGEVAIVTQGGSCDLDGELALQIAVVSEPAPSQRRPLSLTLVVDTSGSMEGPPMARARAAIEALASQLQPGDLVSVVTWQQSQHEVLSGHTVSGPDDPKLLSITGSLVPDGGTDLNGGLRAGYRLARRYHVPGRTSRVVLISDGQANVGVTNEKLIGDNANDADSEGIYLVGVGVGDGFNDTLMDTVTDAGRGAYVYLDSEQEARKMLADRFSETMLVAARDVKVELTLPPYFSMAAFYGEEYSTDPARVRPQHLAPGDASVLLQRVKACSPRLALQDDIYRVKVTYRDALTGQPREVVKEATLGSLDGDDGNLSKAVAIVAYAEALKRISAFVSSDERRAIVDEALREVRSRDPGGDPDFAEIEELLETLRRRVDGL